ncbi:c-type cytochrome [Pedobacter hartonius]|uniref:Photosynthetic reaction center cytochrome c subunit n=1 Tax=Pedobacter hartonius TaxID=425514 RepID=A0A1H4H9J2_9SPHI|nr:c-type cytochrome [Pedobacter hartonius]SEB18090.1 Photosynthetic reaction center cytochrome C subunit [Pedobacter hartonius]
MPSRTLITLSLLIFTVVLMSAFMPQAPNKANNLKILPKDISHEELDKIMDGFKVALGVKCSFCHSADKDDPKHMDFASDTKLEKEMARDMMRMTININKKYFHIKDAGDTKAVLAVSCFTCHNGNAHPDNK